MPTQSEARLAAGLDYLLSGDILWSRRHEPESMRLLGRLWRELPEESAARLAGRAVAGPPDVEDADRRAWQLASRLAEMRDAGDRPLPPEASALLTAYEAAHGPVEAPSSVRLGFEFERLGVPDRAGVSEREMRALKLEELVSLLQEPAVRQHRAFDDTRKSLMALWGEVVPSRPKAAARVLEQLAARGIWPGDTWQATLVAFSGMKRGCAKAALFRRMAPLLLQAPDSFLQNREVAWAIGYWLPGATRVTAADPADLFWQLWDRLAPIFFALPVSLGPDTSPLDAAINEPPGRLTEALLHRFFAYQPKVGQGIPAEAELRLRQVTSGGGDGFLLGRVILARHLTALFMTQQDWAQQHLVPKFSWTVPREAAALWKGFIAGGSIHPKVLSALKDDLLDTLRHHDSEVHRSKEQLWSLLVMACIEVPGLIEAKEAQSLLRSADPEARRHAAFQLYRMMPDDAAKAAAFWEARLGPWIDEAWPKDVGLRDAGSSENLALAAAASGEAFPLAVDLIAGTVVRCNQHFRLVHNLAENDLPERFPNDVLKLLDAITDGLGNSWDGLGLRRLLRRVLDANPDLSTDPRYTQLDANLRRQGG